MAQSGRLTALAIGRLAAPGMYADGGGLYLQVTRNSENEDAAAAKSWIFRYKLNGRERQMGLGSITEFGLQEARERATQARKLRRDGIDPIEARKATRARAALEAAKATTFKQGAELFVKAHRASWRNAKHAGQWDATLENYAFPTIGALSVQAIDTGLVLKVLEPIWTDKPDTASRLRGRIERVLDWAKARGLRDGENPARWRGHLDKLLPATSKVRRVEHHAALPFSELPAFLVKLRAQEGTAARALEFTILTAARTGEVIGGRESEISFADKMWTVPPERTKAGREHRVPLSQRAIEILRDALKESSPLLGGDGEDRFLFQGRVPGRPLSNMAFLMLLRRMGRGDLTAHGFRSSFRDWAAERTNFPRDVAEMALAHAIGDKVEAAYRRGDLFERRRRMMVEWAKHCENVKAPRGAVLQFGRGGGRSRT